VSGEQSRRKEEPAIRRIVVLAAAVFAFSAAGAGAHIAPTWNGGYANGWWPGGFGYPPVTVQAPAYPAR